MLFHNLQQWDPLPQLLPPKIRHTFTCHPTVLQLRTLHSDLGSLGADSISTHTDMYVVGYRPKDFGIKDYKTSLFFEKRIHTMTHIQKSAQETMQSYSVTFILKYRNLRLFFK